MADSPENLQTSPSSDGRQSGAQAQRRKVTINNSLGLHARPASLFVQMASQFAGCQIKVARLEDDPVDGKSIMGLMMLAAAQGTQLVIEVQGPDAEEALNRLAELVESRFGEE